MISFIETTGDNLAKDAKWAWSKFRNAEIAKENSKIAPINSPIQWTNGECYECGAEVQPTATGCWRCHYSFCE